MPKADAYKALLAKIPTIPFRERLVRKVPYGPFATVTPPNFLFTSGRPNRYNPAGLDCIYFSIGEPTAELEYRRDLPGSPGEFGPVVTFWANADLKRVLDLTDRKIVKALGMNEKELSTAWRGVATPTATQLLGKAAARHSNIAAILYPSDAARNAGTTGTNIVLYRERIVSPNRLSVIGQDGKPIQGWP